MELDDRPTEVVTPRTGADLIDPSDPAFAQIARAALELSEFGYDPAEPDVARRAIDVGRARYARGGPPAIDEPDAPTEPVNPFACAPGEVVYYMRIGNRVKIGWSRNLPLRMAAINPEELMVTEPGNRLLERARHKQFADLRVHGEWFHLDARITQHVEELRRLNEQEERDTA